MNKQKAIVVSSTYLGPVSYFASLYGAKQIFIEAEEHYIKQTWRNRCRIATANGTLDLTIPVIKVNGNHTRMRDIEIAYSENWQRLHWRAIVSAYRHSPFFLFFEDHLRRFYTEKFTHLLNFNTQLTHTILQLAGISRDIQITDQFQTHLHDGKVDLRDAFSPKRSNPKQFPSYIQVFRERHSFIPDLSILDLLLNMGPETKAYLDLVNGSPGA